MAAADAESGILQRMVVTAVVIGVGVLVVSSVVGVGVDSLSSLDGSVRVEGDDAVVLQNNDDVTQVSDSTGRAARLSGGEVAISGGLGVRDDPDDRWAFGTYASVSDSSRASIYWSLGQELVVGYTPDNGGELFAWYYNASSTNSYVVRVAASDPTALSPMLLERDGQTMTLTNATGSSESVTLTHGTSASAPLPTTNTLNGRLEETRAWDRPLASAEAQTYRSDGIEPVAVGNRSARLLFDTTGDGVAIEFRDASGELRGAASRGDGLAGTTMTRGTDFAIRMVGNNEAVVPLNGGALEDQPRIALSTPRTMFEQFVVIVGAAFGLAGVVLILAVARRILSVIQNT
jgi:hypothetical protein